MHELLWTVRTVAAGRRALPAVLPRVQAAAAARLEPADHPIFAMKLAGTAPAEIAATLGLARADVADRTAAILARLSTREATVHRPSGIRTGTGRSPMTLVWTAP